ncbi:MAG: TatD family hydrolase [Balneolaceae bacterium]
MSQTFLTDTHCHLYLDAFRDDLEPVLNRAAAAGIQHIWLPAIDWGSLRQMDGLNHPDITFHRMAGIHPCEVVSNWPLDETRLYDLLSRDLYEAVGETGLDYYWSRDHKEDQKQSLAAHCRISKAVNKPIVLHNRESTSDLLDLIESEQDGTLRGVWHCFTGSEQEAKRALDLGLYLGVGGILTFKNSGVDDVVRTLPADRLLIETDAPYLAPTPKRGKRNEPSFVQYTAEYLAGVLDLSFEELAVMTTENAMRLFQPADESSEG